MSLSTQGEVVFATQTACLRTARDTNMTSSFSDWNLKSNKWGKCSISHCSSTFFNFFPFLSLSMWEGRHCCFADKFVECLIGVYFLRHYSLAFQNHTFISGSLGWARPIVTNGVTNRNTVCLFISPKYIVFQPL